MPGKSGWTECAQQCDATVRGRLTIGDCETVKAWIWWALTPSFTAAEQWLVATGWTGDDLLNDAESRR